MGATGKYNDYMKYYSRTAEAHKLEQPAPTVVRLRRVRRRSTVFKYIGSNVGLSACSIFTIVLLFAGVFSMVLLSANISNSRADIATLNKELKKTKEEYQLLQAEISSSYDLAMVEKIATTELGMSRPKSHQIVYVSVPKQSYIVQYRTEEAMSNQTGIFSYLIGWVKSLLKLE